MSRDAARHAPPPPTPPPPGRDGLASVDVRALGEDRAELRVGLIRGVPRPHLERKNVKLARRAGGEAPKIVIGPEWDPDSAGSPGRGFRLVVEDPGDLAAYTIQLVGDDAGLPPGIDPCYARIDFRFRPTSDGERDCAEPGCSPVPPGPPALEIDYLAKDYASFRRVMLDRLSQTLPGWHDRHVPGLGVTMVEAMAYVADHLSYFQDAVGTEAYLDTARRRVSVRRHARLVDYPMHDGSNARAWVRVEIGGERFKDSLALPPDDVLFYTDPPRRPGSAPRPSIRKAADLLRDGEEDRAVFAPVVPRPDGRAALPFDEFRRTHPRHERFRPAPIRLYPEHNRMALRVEAGDGDCLPRGATSATLRGPLPRLEPGMVLILQEIVGPVTGLDVDADPSHRWAVRLTRVRGGDSRCVEVEWFEGDALPFPLCVRRPGRGEVSIAYGNVVLVDHGQWVEATPLEPSGDGASYRSDCLLGAWVHKPIAARPITQAAPFPDPAVVAEVQAGYLGEYAERLRLEQERPGGDHLPLLARVEALLDRLSRGVPLIGEGLAHEFRRMMDAVPMTCDPHPLAALCGPEPAGANEDGAGVAFEPSHPLTFGPASSALAHVPETALPAVVLHSATTPKTWRARRDLLGDPSGPRSFVVEVDDEGLGHLRFGDEGGQAPPPNEPVHICARAGNGSAGNVGAEAIVGLVGPSAPVSGVLRVTNPMPASGGVDPEPAEAVKRLAPSAFRGGRRAVVADDYARLAESDPRVQRAAAVLLWTGLGHEVRVALDLRDFAASFGGRRARRVYREVRARLDRARRIGHEVRVVPARTIPVAVTLRVGLERHAFPAPVEAALRDILARGVRADGSRSPFHPDKLSFGSPISEGVVTTEAKGVDGVAWVKVEALRRRVEGRAGDLAGPEAGGLLKFAALEIPRFDDAQIRVLFEAEGRR